MVTFTIRFSPALERELDFISEITGVVKTSLILFALNDVLRGGKPIRTDLALPGSPEPSRKSIRFPDGLKPMIESRCQEEGMSANSLVSTVVHQVNQEYWLPLLQAGKTKSMSE